MLDEAIKLDSNSSTDVAAASDYNNKAVMLMNLSKLEEAYDASRKALILFEPIVIYTLINRFSA